jgi:hypothetical protein
MPQPPQVDLFDPIFKANPYPTYAQLRSSAPIHRITLPDGRGVWLVPATKTSWPSSRISGS